ncbi:MAG: TonB family protein [Thiobacillaceae bacterium]|nr:TonB family protein [Thiobacillaceae bacterium]
MRFRPGAAAAVVLAHGVAALAMPEAPATGPEQPVLRAVILPTVKVEPPPPPPPPPPLRRPPTPARAEAVAQPTPAQAEWSDQAESAAAAPVEAARVLQASPQPARTLTAAHTASAWSDAPAVQAEAPQARPSPPAPVRPAAPTTAELHTAGARLQLAEASMTADTSAPHRRQPTVRSSAAAPLVSTPATAMAAAPADEPLAAAPGEVARAQARAAVVAPTAPPLPGPAALSAPVAPSQVLAQPPAEVEAPRLVLAQAGRPVPVSGTEGAYESADYAEGNPALVYPRLAQRLGLEGTVILEVEVLPDGRPGRVRLRKSSGHSLLDQDAMTQILTWRFKPPMRHGRPHTTWVGVPIHYRLTGR